MKLAFWLSSLFIFQTSFAAGPCSEDAQKFCGTEMNKPGKLIKCMRKHVADLSSACRESGDVEISPNKFVTFKKISGPCEKDLKQFCPGLAAAEAVQCMKTKSGQLSKECSNLINLKDNMKKAARACGQDIKKYCPSSDQSSRAKCIRENKASFSKDCAEAGFMSCPDLDDSCIK